MSLYKKLILEYLELDYRQSIHICISLTNRTTAVVFNVHIRVPGERRYEPFGEVSLCA